MQVLKLITIAGVLKVNLEFSYISLAGNTEECSIENPLQISKIKTMVSSSLVKNINAYLKIVEKVSLEFWGTVILLKKSFYISLSSNRGQWKFFLSSSNLIWKNWKMNLDFVSFIFSNHRVWDFVSWFLHCLKTEVWKLIFHKFLKILKIHYLLLGNWWIYFLWDICMI